MQYWKVAGSLEFKINNGQSENHRQNLEKIMNEKIYSTESHIY